MFENHLPIRDGELFPPAYQQALQNLWQDRGIQAVVSRGNEAALPEKYVSTIVNFVANYD